MADITMPQLGETVTEGTITRWAKKVGDRVEVDEVLFEVSTDKVDSEVPSAAAGILTEVLVPEGETVDVGTRLAVISDAPANGAAGAQAPPTEAPPADAPAADAPPADAPPADAPPADAPPAAAPAAAATEATEAEAPAASDGAAPPAAAPPPAKAPAAAAPPPPAKDEASAPADAVAKGDPPMLSPVVRRLVAEHNLDPSTIKGTGTGGRITRDDVLTLIDAKAGGATASPSAAAAPAAKAAPAPAAPAAAAPAAAPSASAPSSSAPSASAPSSSAPGRDEVIPFSKIRKLTAEHMVRSLDTSAHTLVVVEVDYEGVEKVRRASGAAFKENEGASLTYLPFISRAVVDAIAEFPHLNSSVGNEELIVHRYVNLGIAVDLNFEGLLVPVIHDADGKRLRQIAREIHDLATRARTKRLTADDITGGTFTLTNAGPFGTFMTAAVINQPQVAILSTDGVKKKPVVVTLPDGTDAIVIHAVGNLALSFDHRAFDGAYAAAFLSRIRDILETRDWAQEL